jgi:serine protease
MKTLRLVVAFLLSLLLMMYSAPNAAAAVEARPAAPNDPLWSEQWNLASQPGVAIDVREAWRYGRGTGVVIAVVDSGYVSHPEFEGRVLPGYDFISEPEVANDGDGRDADPSDPGDWATEAEASSGDFGEECKAEDSSWHGTHVAGIALAAADNGIGLAGIAPLAKLLPVRVVGKCGGSQADLVDGMRWAAGLEVAGAPINQNPADVINLSLGGQDPCSSRLQQAINEIAALNIMMVAAVGNEGIDASSFSPANCTGTATVGALTVSGAFASYSNYGSFVDLSAPGGDQNGYIVSTINTGKTTPIKPGYGRYSGTSVATPHLSGVLAIARGYDPLTPSDALYEVLFTNLQPFSVDLGSSSGCLLGLCGVGALDAGRFLAALEARPTPLFSTTIPEKVLIGGAALGTLLLDDQPVTQIEVRTPTLCAWDGQELRGLARGTCELRITAAGSAVKQPFTYDATFTIGGLTPTLTQSLPLKLRVGSSARISAVTDSGGMLTYKSRTRSICNVGAKGRVTALARGTCRVRVIVAASSEHDQLRVTLTTTVRR